MIHEDNKTFLFDSQRVLKNIDSMNNDFFIFVENSSKIELGNPPISLKWKQNDYLKVAEKIQEYAWGETNALSTLTSFSLHLNCSDIELGMYKSGWISFVDIVKKENGETRIEYKNYIYPFNNYGSTTKIEYYPNLYQFERLDFQKINISAEKALQIAEENGGSKVRQDISNICKISTVITGQEKKGWRISYLDTKDSFKCYFRIFINPITGESEEEPCK